MLFEEFSGIKILSRLIDGRARKFMDKLIVISRLYSKCLFAICHMFLYVDVAFCVFLPLFCFFCLLHLIQNKVYIKMVMTTNRLLSLKCQSLAK